MISIKMLNVLKKGVKIKIYKYWYMIEHIDGSFNPVYVVATNYRESRTFVDRWNKEQNYPSPVYRSKYLERTDIRRKEKKVMYDIYLKELERYGYYGKE